MKLPMKVAGLCWSVTFLVTAVPGFYQQTRPMDFASISTETFSGMAIVETLSISLIGSIAAAMIGYMIGDILSSPQGMTKAAKKAAARPSPAPVTETPESASTPEATAESEADAAMPEESLEADVNLPLPEAEP